MSPQSPGPGAQTTQDLGLVAGIISSPNPPTNFKVLWYNELLQKPFFYDIGVGAWVQLGGGGGSVVKNTYTVSLTNGKTMGAIKDGDVITAGTSISDLLNTALVETKYPTYTPASLSLTTPTPSGGEAGEVLSGTLTATFNQGDAGTQSALHISQNGTPIGPTVATPTTTGPLNVTRTLGGTTFTAYVSYGAGGPKIVQPANIPDSRTPSVRNPNSPQAAENDLPSNAVFVVGYRALFFGPGLTPTGRASALALGGFQTTDQGNAGTINVGGTGLDFVILLPPGRTLVSVKHRELSNATITTSYVAQAQITVKDPSGVDIAGYTPYRLHVTAQYGPNNHHDFIYA